MTFQKTMAGGYFAFFVLAHRAFAAVWPSVRRFVKLALVASNPVRGIEKFKGTGGRLVCLTGLQEAARDALSSEIRLYFVFALNTGFRWSKQMDLQWFAVDFLSKVLTVGKDKNGQALRVPFNTATEGVLLEMGAQRIRPNDPHEPVFPSRYREPDKFLRAVQRAQEAFREAGKHDEAVRLSGVSWHGLRHTWASRLTMAGVDPRTLQTLGGCRSLSMVGRYSHLSPDHLRAALEKLVAPASRLALESKEAPVSSFKLDSNLTRLHDVPSRALRVCGGVAEPGRRRPTRNRIGAQKVPRGFKSSPLRQFFSMHGGVTERPKVRHWKCRARVTPVPRVRIPAPPPDVSAWPC